MFQDVILGAGSTETYNKAYPTENYYSSTSQFKKNDREYFVEYTNIDIEQNHIEADPKSENITNNVRITRKERKEKRNSGQSYITSKGKLVRAKKLQPLGKCRNNCRSKLSEDKREELFKSYWNLGNYEERCSYVASLMSVNDKVSFRPRCADTDRQRFRQVTYKYYFNVDGSRIKVCKSCFLKTLDESDGFAKHVGLWKRTTSEDAPFKDGRGTAKTSKKRSEENLLKKEQNHNESDPVFDDVTKLNLNEDFRHNKKGTTRVDRKERRNRGQSYITSKGKLIKAKKLQPLPECRNNCKSKLSEDKRKRLFKNYWNLGNYAKRCSYLASLITVNEKASFRPRCADSDKQRFRQVTFKYYFDVDDSRINVCKSCFLKTLDESDGLVKHVGVWKRTEDVSFKDGRGKAPAKHKWSDEKLFEVQNHIISFSGIFTESDNPTNSGKSDLTRCKLYEHYRECIPTPVGRRTYYQEFRKIIN